MSDNDLTSVRELIAILDGAEPLSQQQIIDLDHTYQQANKVDWMASDGEVQRQIEEVQERQQKERESPGHKLWEESLSRDRADDLRLHAQLIENLFQRFLETGDIPPPASAWRIAVILRKRKEFELEKAFLAAWTKHFREGPGAKYEKLSKRYQDLIS